MSKTLYVGNLPWTVTEDEVQRAFARHGQVESARIITDRESGRSRGYGFIEIADGDAEQVVTAMNGTMLGGREITVNLAQPRVPR